MAQTIDTIREFAASIMCHEQLSLAGASSESSSKVIFLMSPEYRNYGDVAIAEGALRLLRAAVGESNIVELGNTLCTRWPEKVAQIASPNDVLVFTGGGYMGSLWPDSQLAVEAILHACPSHAVVMLPQTIYYDESVGGEPINRFRKLLFSRNNLYVYLRDNDSLRFVTTKLGLVEGKNCGFAPDCALLLDNLAWRGRRRGAAVCLRHDLESAGIIDEMECAQIISGIGYRSRTSSTTGPLWMPLPIDRRHSAFLKHLRQIQSSELVVTDRLHATILSALSGTPCVAFDNTSHKVSGVVTAWLSELSYVRVVSSPNELSSSIIDVCSVPEVQRMTELEAVLKRVQTNSFVSIAARLSSFLDAEEA